MFRQNINVPGVLLAVDNKSKERQYTVLLPQPMEVSELID